MRFGNNGCSRYVRRGGRRVIGYVIVVVSHTIVSVVLFGFLIIDDGIVGDVGYSFIVFVDDGVLGVNVGQVGTIVGVDIAVPGVVVDGYASVVCNGSFQGLNTNRNGINLILVHRRSKGYSFRIKFISKETLTTRFKRY